MENTSNDYNVDFTPETNPSMPLIKRTHFREKPLEVRIKKYEALMSKKENENRIPIICELHKSSQLSLKSDLKFLTHQNMILKSFQGSIRKKMNFAEDTILFFYQGKKILQNSQQMGELYQRFKAEDGFLYLQFSEINALG
jgi:hypothetical protein